MASIPYGGPPEVIKVWFPTPSYISSRPGVYMMRSDIAVRAVLFDLDNTLVRFIDAHRAACAAVVDLVGAGTADDLFTCFLRPVHGFESPEHIEDYLASIGCAADYDRAVALYEAAKLAALEPYAGVADVLGELCDAGLPLGVVSDADALHAAARLERCGLSCFFEVVVTPDVTGERKPAAANFLYALDCLESSPTSAVMVGDSLRRDIEPANRLGLTSVHAVYGDWHPGYDCTPDHRLDTITALPPIVVP
jgi:putative hydrolase of the HAD superfamily